MWPKACGPDEMRQRARSRKVRFSRVVGEEPYGDLVLLGCLHWTLGGESSDNCGQIRDTKGSSVMPSGWFSPSRSARNANQSRPKTLPHVMCALDGAREPSVRSVTTKIKGDENAEASAVGGEITLRGC